MLDTVLLVVVQTKNRSRFLGAKLLISLTQAINNFDILGNIFNEQKQKSLRPF